MGDTRMRAIRGRHLYEIDGPALARLRAGTRDVLLDIGTGDGVFVHRHAREHPETLAIGLDPVARNMARVSSKLGRKPSRGGVANMLFVVGTIESPPGLLEGIASRITIHFPWGSLLGALVRPDAALLAQLAWLAARPCRIDMLLNASLFEEPARRDRLDLPNVTIDYVDRVLAQAYPASGLVIRARSLIGAGPLPVRTSWGQHLSLNSLRETLAIEIEVT